MIDKLSNTAILEKFWNSSIDGMAISNNEGIVIKANSQYFNIYGFSESEIIGQNFAIIFPKEMREMANQQYKEVFNGNTIPPKFESQIQRKDGIMRTVLSRIDFLYSENQKIALLSVITDITEQKIAEKQILEQNEILRLAFENDRVAWWDWDYASGEVKFSPNKATMIGYSVDEFPTNVYKICDLIHPDDYNQTMQIMLEHLQGKAQFYEVIYRIKTKSNTYNYYYDFGKIIERASDGKPKRLFGIVFNINQQKIVENELHIAKTKAEESDRLKSAFLNNISHEIRTPMNAISGFTDLLLTPNISIEKQSYFAGIIQKSVKQLLNVVENTITISSIETNQLKFNKIDFDPNILILELFYDYKRLQPKIEKMHIELKLNITQNLNVSINNDFTRIKQIINILLDNAFKFTNSGEIEVGYTLETNLIKFYVSDTGIGISTDKQEIVLKSFHQANERIRQLFGGIGLGLSIAIGLIRFIGGKLLFNSVENKGTYIGFSLPLELTENNINHSDNKEINALDKINLLVAEDEDFNFQFIKDLLFETKINIIRAVNGQRAVDIVKNQAIDVILMDIKMPIMDGFEATIEIRKINNRVPIIAQTAFSDKREDCLKAGFTDYLSKPFDEEQLLRILTKYIDIL